MKVLDAIGGELNELDGVVIDLPLVVGQIVKIESGEIARGILLDGGKPAGQQLPPHMIVKIDLTKPELIQMIAPGVGQVPGVLKVVKPASTGNVQ
jgi:hypothetical protein